MSYNRWLYTYAQPINNVDPSGLESVYDTLAEFKDDYDRIHNKDAARWAAQERNIVVQALIDIGVAYAKAYNAEAEDRGRFGFCPPA